MRAAVYDHNGGPEVLHTAEVPDPECRPGGVVIDVEVVSIEGGDTLNRAGGPLVTTPHVVGYQCAGTISEVGAQVTDRHVGQRVVATMAHGSHAEKVAVPAGSTWPVPDGADITTVACVPIAFGTAHDCLFEFGRLTPGETVLVQAGAGGVGLAAIQLARRAGATVITTASSQAKREAALRVGAHHAIDYTADGWVDEVRAITDGRGVALAVDSVGGRILVGSLRCLAYRGRAVTVGQAGRAPKPIELGALGAGNQSITGVFLGAEIGTNRARAMIGALIDDVAADHLEVVIDSAHGLDDAAAAHARVEDRAAIGRVILDLTR